MIKFYFTQPDSPEMNPYETPGSAEHQPESQWSTTLITGMAAGIGSWGTMLFASKSGSVFSPTTVLGPGQVAAAEMNHIELGYIWTSYLLAAIAVILLVMTLRRRLHRTRTKMWMSCIVFAIFVSMLPTAIYLVRGVPISL
ncbi:hypothetical protein [Rhodopirellula sp. MGV]|uniref:hypothetical protein n=1 Tax=Rhodopirellula sp. MGV TaxID=2023130 RepID=UPI00117BC776|nr:hypothetical protein [Rhodopirellula sp. MGV]